MLNEKRIVEGFIFDNDEEYQLALKDKEMFDILWKKIRNSDGKVVLELYETLILSDKIKTVVGMYNVKLVQNYLIKNGYVTLNEITPIVGFVGKRVSTNDAMKTYEYKYKMKYLADKNVNDKLEKYKSMISTLKIAVIILSIVVAIMFGVQINGGTANYASAKEDIIDEYSEWEENLNNREKEVKEREEELKAIENN